MLAASLVEHLPFETDPLTIITTVRLVLQPGLVSDETRARLWTRAVPSATPITSVFWRRYRTLPAATAGGADGASTQTAPGWPCQSAARQSVGANCWTAPGKVFWR